MIKPLKKYEDLNKIINNQTTHLKELDQILKKQSEDIKLVRELAENKKSNHFSKSSSNGSIITSDSIVHQTKWMPCSNDDMDQGNAIKMLIGQSLNYIKAEGSLLTPLHENNVLDEATNHDSRGTSRATSKQTISTNAGLKPMSLNSKNDSLIIEPSQSLKYQSFKFSQLNSFVEPSQYFSFSNNYKAPTECLFCFKTFKNSELGLHMSNCEMKK